MPKTQEEVAFELDTQTQAIVFTCLKTSILRADSCNDGRV